MSNEKYSGKIKQVYVKKLDEPKTFTFKDPSNGMDKTVTSTHRHSLQMDDDNWYGFGDADKDAFLAKDLDDAGKYKILGAGSTATIRYTLSPCGKYRNAKKSGLSIDDFVVGKKWEENQSDASTGTTSYAGKSSGGGGYNLDGVKTGHALNAAMLLKNNTFAAPSEIAPVAAALHDLSVRVEAKYKELNPSMSARDVGAAAGNSMLNACKLTDDIDTVGKIALSLLTKVVPLIHGHVTGKAIIEQAGGKDDAEDSGEAEAAAIAAEQEEAKQAAEQAAKEAKAEKAKIAKAEKAKKDVAKKETKKPVSTPDSFTDLESTDIDF